MEDNPQRAEAKPPVWAYYRRRCAHPVLFRESDTAEEIMEWMVGWTATRELSLLRMQGEINSSDQLTEAQAQVLVLQIFS